MMKKILYSFPFLFSSFALFGQDFDWYQETWSGLRDIELSDDGTVTVAGTYYHEDATVNGITLNTHGIGTYVFDPFVAQYDKDGTLLWVQTGWIDGYGFQYLNDAATDSENSAIVTGYFGDELRFCSNSLIPEGWQDIFVAKYSSTGECLWARKIGGAGSDFAYSVKTDASNNIYVSGNYDGTITVDGQTFNGSGSMSNQAIIKLDPNGNLVWLHTTHASSLQRFDVMDDGIVYIAGDSQNYFELDGNNQSITPGQGNQYIIKLTENGQTDWVKYIDSPFMQSSRDIVIDDNGNAYIHCGWLDDVTIDGVVVSTNQESEKILKINSQGDVDWYTEFLGDTSQCFGAIPRLTKSHTGLPCISCRETEIIDSLNYQNYTLYGFTYATFNPVNGDVDQKVLYPNLKYLGRRINFDQYGGLHAIGGDLDGAQFNGTNILPPDEGVYIYKLNGEFEEFEGGFVYYPNPSTGFFNIQLEPQEETEYLIEFFDIKGRVVYSKAITIEGLELIPINGEQWAEGVYQGRITSPSENHKFKVVVQ